MSFDTIEPFRNRLAREGGKLNRTDMQKLVLDVFGWRMLAEREDELWRLYFPGTEGKRRPVPDIFIPKDVITPEALLQFLDDHFHECATTERSAVRLVRS